MNYANKFEFNEIQFIYCIVVNKNVLFDLIVVNENIYKSVTDKIDDSANIIPYVI